jgi:hypothetical protein
MSRRTTTRLHDESRWVRNRGGDVKALRTAVLLSCWPHQRSPLSDEATHHFTGTIRTKEMSRCSG